MKAIKTTLILAITAMFFGCSPTLPENYHMDKRYWDVSDYDEAIRYIEFVVPQEEGHPRLSDPMTAPVFMKLVDKQNVSVVLEDQQLGLKHKKETSEEFFEIGKKILGLYHEIDTQDKFIYPVECVRSIEFFLYVQLHYFKLGNDLIIKDAVNPEDAEVQRVVRDNNQVIVNNFNIYLEALTKEDAFNDAAIAEYASLIDVYFDKLLKEYSGADFTLLKETAVAMGAKVKSEKLKKSLADLVDKINQKNSSLELPIPTTDKGAL